MPNPNTIEYSSSTQSGAFLRKGNFYLGVTDQDYGPSETTGFYNGVTFSSGYMTYIWDETQIRYNYSPDTTSLTNFLSSRAFREFSTITASIHWAMTQSNLIILNRNYENLVTNGLVLNLDASFVSSYPGTAATWYDTAPGANNAALTNGPSFTTLYGGGISFDGVNDFAQLNVLSFSTSCTVCQWIRPTIVSNGVYQTLRLSNLNSATSTLDSRVTGTLGSTWYHQILVSGYPAGFAEEFNLYFQSIITTFVERNLPYFYCITFQRTPGVNSTLRTFLNGRFRESQSSTSNYWSNIATFATSRYVLSSINSGFFRGSIHSTQIYDRALTDSEILQNYQSTYTRFLGENIVTNGLVAHLDATWPGSFTTASNTWTNVSGTGANATLLNGATYSSADGGSIFFDGVNDYVTFSPQTLLGRNWSMSAWVNCFTYSGGETIFAAFAGTGDGFSTGTVANFFGSTSRNIGWYLDNQWQYSANNIWAINTWYNLVATVDANTRSYRCYLNGTLVLSYTASNTAGTASLFGVGATTGPTRYFPGRISQYLAYNRTLTQAEVIQNFNATKARYGL